MPTEFMQASDNRHDGSREVAYLSHHVRGLQTEVTTVVNECLQELDSLCELLRSLETSTEWETAPRRPQPAERHRDPTAGGSAPSMPATRSAPTYSAPPPAYAATESATDFDARLANLKRLLAEKLTESEALANLDDLTAER